MATTGTEKFSRTVLTVQECGTKLARKLFKKCMKDLSPGTTVDVFLLNKKTEILKSKSARNKKYVIFPDPPGTETDLRKWDIQLFCAILRSVCELKPVTRIRLKELKDIRNKLYHMSNASLEDRKYEEYQVKIDCIFEHCLPEIGDPKFIREITVMVEQFRKGPLSMDQTITAMHSFFQTGREQMEILEKHSKDHEGMDTKLDRTDAKMDTMLSKLESIDSRLQKDSSLDIPGIGITIELGNCTPEQEKAASEVLINIFNDIINNRGSSLKEELPNGVLHEVRQAVEQIFNKFLTAGINVVAVKQKCIMLTIEFGSLTSFIGLLRDYKNGNLTKQMNQLQQAIQTVDDCAGVELEVVIYKGEFCRVMDNLVLALEEHVPAREYVVQPFRPHGGQASCSTESVKLRKNGVEDIRLTGIELPSTTSDSNQLRLTIKTGSHAIHKHIQECFEKDGMIQNGMKYVEKEIGIELNIPNLSVTAHLVGEVEYGGSTDVNSTHSCQNTDLGDDEDFDDIDATRRDLHLQSSMQTDTKANISESIERGYDSLHSGNVVEAKRLVLHAMESADQEKASILAGTKTTVTEQELADWYEDCSFILNQIGEYITATRCYYTAAVFDTNWNHGRHMFLSDLLWGLFFSTRQRVEAIYQKVKPLLSELDTLAELAERWNKWNISAAIYEDLNALYMFLGRHGESDVILKRTHSMKRLAKCYLEMGLHHNARKYCIKILQEFSDYDDSEALDMWALSLYETNDFELAFDKCELALKYCMHEDETERLKEFRAKIQNKLTVESVSQSKPDVDWLEGTNFNQTKPKQQPATKKKKRHERPKAKDRSGKDVHLQKTAASETEAENTAIDDTTSAEIKSITTDQQRCRHSSEHSTATSETSVPSFGAEKCVDYSASDSEFDEPCSIGNAVSATSPKPSMEGKSIQDELSFYEQSCKMHQQNEQQNADDENMTNYEKLLKTGIHLNRDYLNRFEDKHPDVLKRDEFYPEFLDKVQLEQKLKQNPKEYVKSVIEIEGPHEAYCTPVDSNNTMGVIEIFGRSNIGQVFNEDEVVVKILHNNISKQKRHGKVIGVWNRQRHKNINHPVFICTFHEMESHLVRPICKTIPKIHVLDREIRKQFKTQKERYYKIEQYDYDEQEGVLCNLPRIKEMTPEKQDTYVCLVAFINWGSRHVYPRGAIIKLLPSGHSETSGLTILNLQHEVPRLYTKTTVEEVSKMIDNDCDEPEKRKDLTQLNIFTIDKTDSTDLNYAFSIQKEDDGYKVGVHVADVAAYVPKGSPVDNEAKFRTTTFNPKIRKPRYMIPEPLSLNLCSLVPLKQRRAISVFLSITDSGRPLQKVGRNYEIVKSFIISKRHLTYAEARELVTVQSTHDDTSLSKDIKTLFHMASEVRSYRLGNAKYALNLGCESTSLETIEPKYVVEECLTMANKKIAERLLRTYRTCVPIHYKPPPRKEAEESFLKKYDIYLDIILRLQGKQVGPKQPSVRDCKISPQHVILSKMVWEAMAAAPKNASLYLRKDDLHPLQLEIYHQWLSIQEPSEYKCSGSISKEETKNVSHTCFTSPLRRYSDLIVQRLIHAAVFNNESCPYSEHEMDSVCMHMNSVMKRADAYENGCRCLQEALRIKEEPKMINCFVDDISERGITLCSPKLAYVAKQNKELTFKLLDLSAKPEILKDPNTNWNRVKAVWRKRLYDFHVRHDCATDLGDELKLNPHEGVVYFQLHKWAKLLAFMVDGDMDGLTRAIKHAAVSPVKNEGLDDVSTECFNKLQIQPYTEFSRIFSRGQQVNVQMSSALYMGMMTPKPMLYDMTNNVKFCLQHSKDPVLYLYHYANRPTCDRYTDVQKYLERWTPIILMESATGIIHNEESCCIRNVPIKCYGERSGKFALGLAECEVRNIEFSGTISDDGDCNDEETGAYSYDWLCLKATLTNADTTTSKMQSIQQPDTIWVGHAQITKVKRTKAVETSGKITVSFTLHEKSPAFPKDSATTKFSIEILRKTEGDRRTEHFIKMLPMVHEQLATRIALNSTMPDLDKNYSHIADLVEHDLCYEVSSEDKHRRPLPRNNDKQQKAIDIALMSRFSLIQGPPGTGKTYTGIKLIYLFNKINYSLSKEGNERKQVLFCGPSNKSVDLVAKWMYDRMGKQCPKFVRVYGRSIEAIDFPIPGRTFQSKRSTKSQSISESLRPVALPYMIRRTGNTYAKEINMLDEQFKANNYMPMPFEVKKYVHLVREASIEEIRKYDVILCTTAVASNPKVLEASRVHQVIFDEAGMCTEPQCLVPIIATKAEQVVLIGDHMQLKPVVMCKEAKSLGLETSLFERYAKLKTSKSIKFTMLTEQYRMNPEICRFPSQQFYNGDLTTKPGLWRSKRMEVWPRIDNKIYPHVFVHVYGEEKMLTVTTEDGNEQSKSNAEEIEHVIAVYSYLTGMRQSKETIHIMSQYNAQCSEIRRKLKEKHFDDTNVSTVVSSQGGEWDYVIFSTVRSLPKYKIDTNPTLGWSKHNLGFITDSDQINVALTRARKGLVIIGNKDLLACNSVWKNLIQHYEERGCIKTTEEFPPQIKRFSQML